MEEDLANFEAKSKQNKSANRSGLVTIIAAKRKPKLSTEKLIKKVISAKQ